jgi:hypothetical protein
LSRTEKVTQLNNTPIQTVIGEFKNISPEIVNCFVFDETGEILAIDEDTGGEESKNLILTFKNLADHAYVIGGIQALTIHGAENQLNIIQINNQFLTTIFTRSANENVVKSLTQVIVPTVLSLVCQNGANQESNELFEPVMHEPELLKEESPPITIAKDDDLTSEVSDFSSEPSLPITLASQFMVEKIGGLLVASDTVRIDNEVITKWNNLYENTQIVEVQIENLEGKTVICKFKPIKEANAKGIIQIPEKILQTLQIGKGKLVMVKPVITQIQEKED